MKTIRSFFLFSILFWVACSIRPSFYGTIDLLPDGNWQNKVYLIDPGSFDGIARSYIGTVIDSAILSEDGSFAFEKMPHAPESILLQIAIQQKEERYLNKLDNEDPGTANYFPIIWKNGEHLEVSASADRFQSSFSIKDPSPENAAMLELRDLREQAFEKYLTEEASELHHEAGLLDAEKALMDFRQPMIEFAETSPFLLPALTAIRWISIEADYERIPEFMVAQCEQWQEAKPMHPWSAQLCRYGDRKTLPILIGDPIPDFPLPMLSGDTLPLSQLLGKKLSILDLWASWCAPCRKENRDYLGPLWEKYHAAGFQIIGYALDASPKVWKGAIEKDGADRWLHASHLQGDDSPFFEALRINTIPANFLLDEEGKVLSKNLHGEELVRFVADYFGH